MGTIRIDKANFEEFIDRVRAGEEITLTDQEQPVARVIPIRRHDPERIRRSIEEMRRMSERNSLGGLRIKDLINEGRP